METAPTAAETTDRILAAINAYCNGYPEEFLFEHYGERAYYRAWTKETGPLDVLRDGMTLQVVDAITDETIPVYTWRDRKPTIASS